MFLYKNIFYKLERLWIYAYVYGIWVNLAIFVDQIYTLKLYMYSDGVDGLYISMKFHLSISIVQLKKHAIYY